jgi:hypothetical protein
VRPTLLTVATLAVVALLGAWFLHTHERVTVQIPMPWRGEARINPFLAAERLLQRLRLDADSQPTLQPSRWLPDPADTLFLPASAALADEQALANLDLWVLGGGHLVLLAPLERSAAVDALFAHFGAGLTEPLPVSTDSKGLPGMRLHDASGDDVEYAFEFDAPLRIDFPEAEFDGAVIDDSRGAFLASRFWGNGFVTLIAATAPFDNAHLATADHGLLLLYSIAGQVDPGKVWFVYDADFPPLWQLIWDNAPFAVLGGALALLLWLAAITPRFGPVVEPPAPMRRSILEHVQAAARFTWRHGAAAALIDVCKDALLRRAETHRPGIVRRPVAEQARLLAELSGMPAESVHLLLAPPSDLSSQTFIDTIQKLQAIRNAL